MNERDPPWRRRLQRLLRRVQFWEAEHSLTVLLVMLIVTLFVVTPLASSAASGSEILMCFLAVLTISGVAAVSGRPIVVAAAVALAVSGIGVDWVAHFHRTQPLRVLDDVLRVLFVLLLAVIVTIQVFRPGNVTHHRVQGAICVYLLAGLAWAFSFDLLALLDPSAFRLAENFDAMPARVSVFRYFSFVTLTTLGYGDILPVSPAARSLATGEALFGQLYPAVMIARLISLELFHRRREDGASGSQE